MTYAQEHPPIIVAAVPTKSVGWSVVLGFFFGPLGMLYSTILGAILLAALWVLVAIATFGFGLIFVHAICAVWAALAAQRHNRRQFRRMTARVGVAAAPAPMPALAAAPRERSDL